MSGKGAVQLEGRRSYLAHSNEGAAQLREAQRIAGIGSWEWAPGSEAVHWSEGLYLISGRDLGLPPPTYQTLSQFYTPESWQRLGAAIARALETRESYELEIEMIHQDGGTRWTSTRGEAVCGPDGAVVKLRGTVHDITELKRAERAYQDRAAQLREAQRIAGIGSWEWAPGTDAVHWSEGLYLILGRDLALPPPTFQTLSQFYTAESWQRLGVVIARSLDTRESYELEVEMIHHDGGTRWTTTRGEAVSEGDGPVIKLRGTVHDISERKRDKGRVEQAERLASMGMLAAGVAHEINNPLSYVLYNVETLAQDLPKVAAVVKRCCAALRAQVGDAAFDAILGDQADLLRQDQFDDATERATEALGGAHRIKAIVKGLGAFSRVESTDLSRIDLKDPIESASNMAFNEIKYRALLVKNYGDVPPVWASEGKLAQVFLNLLLNAAHAIDEGHVERNRITVRTWRKGDDVYAEIADTGKGIPTEHLSRIFEPFFTTKGLGKGSGLGLTMCRNIVTELGGEIGVESELGKGTRFLIRLPIKAAATEGRCDAIPKEPQSQASRGRILVVDDEAPIRGIMKRLLGRDHELVTAASGTEGQAILERDTSFDLILCDLMMPEMTGMDLHQWLEERNPMLAAKMVFITGGAFTPRTSEYLAHAGNLRIEKPFDSANLKTLVAKLISAAKGVAS